MLINNKQIKQMFPKFSFTRDAKSNANTKSKVIYYQKFQKHTP